MMLTRRALVCSATLSAVDAGDPIKCRGNPSQQRAEIRQVDQREQQAAGDPEDVHRGELTSALQGSQSCLRARQRSWLSFTRALPSERK
ncbi:MAG: hypothetical protein K0R61_5432 [Microvirga sp.]|jgi:hypothetical protein|nr:hypothetical protein [Microvirga sp.]